MSKPTLAALALAVLFAPLAFAADDKKPDDKKSEKVDNPEFKTWSKFKAGTTVVAKFSFDGNGMKNEGTTTNKLVEVKDDKLVMETEVETTGPDGKKVKLPAQKRDVPKELETSKLPPGVDVKTLAAEKPEGTTEEGKEKLKIGGTEYECKWYKFKTKQKGFGGEETEVEGQVWTSDDVPGKLVKSTFKAKDASGGSEVTEITVKK